MKMHGAIIICSVFLISASSGSGENADGNVFSSKIDSVKLYQNQAMISRSVNIKLAKGENVVVLGGLPQTLYDWSVKSSLPKDYKGRILSVEVEKKALLKKRENRIADIEKILIDLREKDLELLDSLKENQSEQGFLDSILNFTNQTASKELVTRIPQIKVWDDTLEYVSGKRKALLARKRAIEKKREEIGKSIQKWEFELSQIAGTTYYRNYQTMND
jgi:hypothetical protein